MKPKIGILTIHTDFNYGAVLQAVATQQFLKNNGFDAEIINYENPVVGQQSKLIYKQDNKISGYIKTFIRNTIFGRFYYYKKAVRDLDTYRKISRRMYRSKNDFSSLDYDILIAGSDQIWNPNITRGLDPVFLLNVGTKQKKISVSSSIGSYILQEKDKEDFKNAFESFSHISVREKHAKKQLQQLTTKEIKVLVDPTLLLNKDEWWQALGCKSHYAIKKERYILTYFVGSNKAKYKPIIKSYAQKLRLPVWTIQYSNYSWRESNKKILGASITDFIALISNADLVITDSFHGVAFSLNLGINFVAVSNTENPVRVKELLEELDITERIDMPPEEYHTIDYKKTKTKLDEITNESKKWIIESINH